MAPPAHAKNNKADKPASKPHSLKQFDLAAMPPASSHPGELVAVKDAAGGIPYLALSDGNDWHALATVGLLAPAPEAPTE
jgi:hypothetical protein